MFYAQFLFGLLVSLLDCGRYNYFSDAVFATV